MTIATGHAAELHYTPGCFTNVLLPLWWSVRNTLDGSWRCDSLSDPAPRSGLTAVATRNCEFAGEPLSWTRCGEGLNNWGGRAGGGAKAM
jgi:hypothetical protein